MRLLIKLKALNNISCGKQHFIPIQGFIYSLLKDTSFNHIHQEKNYKFFCFSNLFSQKGNSFNHFKKGKIYNLIISSPNEIFLKTIGKEILTQEKIKIGSAFFKLKTLTFFQPKLSTPLKIATQSPIIIRIPKEKYQTYEIASLQKKYSYLFWRPKYPLEVFIKQLEANIFKKYKKFHQKEIEEFPIFQKFFFKKSVSIPLKIHGKKVHFIGSLWEFHFDYLDKKTKEILEFAIDCGFGENNSKGFGFVNIQNYDSKN